MQKGNIRVHSENIFPIIKKFLYNEHEIFLRELISNAIDATQKLKTLTNLGEAKGELGELAIHIKIDKEKKTLTISDVGIGMTEEEVDKYINQVAFSGAEEFVKKYQGQSETNMIGHFGLGFYSGFMVSDKVAIHTKSFQTDKPAVAWECDGSTEFTIQTIEKEQRGTDIILHLNADSEEFLEPQKIQGILEKFCKFLPIPIFFEDKQVNDTNPIWIKKPSDLTTQDYQDFYKKLYPYNEPPLFWIHLNVDYPFHLTGILYFPLIKQSYEIQKDKINLYCNQVYVTDEVKDIVPEFLMLLHGVIDSPDIPLNVSRSYLQGDPNLKKINAHITKKVADKLEELFKTDRTEFQNKWDYLNLFMKYGMMTDDKFLERAQKFTLFQDVKENKFYTLDEWKAETQALQTNKENKLVVLYTNNPVQQDTYIQAAHTQGYKIMKMESLVDTAFINNIEIKWNDLQFKRIDADIVENLIQTSEDKECVLGNEEQESLKKIFDFKVDQLVLKFEIKGLSTTQAPIIATQAEWMRRMKEMGAMGGGMSKFYAEMPSEITLTLNGNHPLMRKILDDKDAPAQQATARNLLDLALLSQGLLKGTDLTNFIQHNLSLLNASISLQ